MSDPGLHAFGAEAEDAKKSTAAPPPYGPGAENEEKKVGVSVPVVDESSEDQPTAPDQFDPKYETSKWEIWSYYSYYIGANGLALFNFGPSASQDLLYRQSKIIGDEGFLVWAGSRRTINSIVLKANGISFGVQIFLFLVLGSYADFGSWRPNILIVMSIMAYGIGFGWLGVYNPEQWETGLGLYIVGLILYQTTLTFWTAAFPGLARNTRFMRDQADLLVNGEITREQYDESDTLKRSELASIAFYVQSVGEIVILAVVIGIMFSIRVDASDEANQYGLSVTIAFSTGVWLLVSLPWFIMEKRRPGLQPGMNIVLAGFNQLWKAIRNVWRLKQSLFYLIGYFLLGDSLNTTVTVVYTYQNDLLGYSSLYLSYVTIVGIFTQAVGIYSFWWIQKRFKLGTKTMFNAVAVGIIVLDGWGMIGIWTQKFGFHHAWEIWLYQAYYGLFVCPWYVYSQVMISEVTPRGYEFLFFSLFSIMGKTSAFIGPIVSGAIIDASPSGNNSLPFYFLFGLSLLSFAFLLFFVDIKKSRIEQEQFLEEEARKKAARLSVSQ